MLYEPVSTRMCAVGTVDRVGDANPAFWGITLFYLSFEVHAMAALVFFVVVLVVTAATSSADRHLENGDPHSPHVGKGTTLK